jgi:HK97 family phage major capsid protein
MSKLTDLSGTLAAKRDELASIFKEAGPDYDFAQVKSIDGDTQAKVDYVKSLNDEMNDLSSQIKEIEGFASMSERTAELAEVKNHPGHQGPGKTKGEEATSKKSFGELFLESQAFKSKGSTSELPMNLKTTFGSAGGSIAYTGATAGWFPLDQRIPDLTDYYLARQPLRVTDLIPKTTTNAAAVTYFQEQSFTNSAVEVTEGSAKPEQALNVSTVTETVRKVAVWIPVTDEQLADVPQVRSYLENRLGFLVRQRLDAQIIAGNGTAPNLKGILNRSAIQSQAKGTDPTPDAIFKAMQKIRVNDFSEPNGVVLHPNDWTDIRLLRTSDGIYIWGNPADSGPERIWGLDVVVTTAETENTGLVGDFRQAELAMREGLTVRVTDSHSTYFINNIQVVLVELRAALLVYREASFCKVTGI